MECITIHVPPELWGEILTRADKHTLTTMARVSKDFNEMVLAILYKDLDNPMAIIGILNVNMAYNISNGFVSIPDYTYKPRVADLFQTLEMPIIDQQLLRLRHVATRVSHFSWAESPSFMCTECCAIAMTRIYDRVTEDLFPRLQSLHAACTTSHGVQVFLPWLCKPLSKVDLAFGPEVDDITIISCLLRLQQHCVTIASFRLTLDCGKFSGRRGVIDALVSALTVMQKLRHVSLPYDLVTLALVNVLAGSSTLRTVEFTPATSAVVWSMGDSPSLLFSSPDSNESKGIEVATDLDELPDLHLHQLPPTANSTQVTPIIGTPRFYALHDLRLCVKSWGEVEVMVRAMDPYGVTEIVVSLSPGHNKDEAATILESFSTQYPHVEIHLSE